MIATQTTALFVDAYRELNARRLFWICMILSAVVVSAFALVGINEKGLTILHWEVPSGFFNTDLLSPASFYKLMFINLGIKFWLTWGAAILALVSTASIFPDFLAGGAIELTLSKPLGRLRLFLTKYVAGLLFVALQVAVFSTGAFLIIGLKGGSWEPGLFLAIPIVLAFFSYLFAVCVLLGVVTRSTIASLIITLILWFVFSMSAGVETLFHQLRLTTAKQVEITQADIERREKAIAAVESGESNAGFAAALLERMSLPRQQERLEQQRERLVRDQERAATWERIHTIAFAARTVMPKTGETTDLLNRGLISEDEFQRMLNNAAENQPRRRNASPEPSDADFDPGADPREADMTDPEIQRTIAGAQRERSLWWVLGTSFAFEGLILALAAWLFCRRDF